MSLLYDAVRNIVDNYYKSHKLDVVNPVLREKFDVLLETLAEFSKIADALESLGDSLGSDYMEIIRHVLYEEQRAMLKEIKEVTE